MKNCIQHIEIVSSQGFSISEINLASLYETYGHSQLPEVNVLDQYISRPAVSGRVHIDDGFWWCGMFSGESFGVLREMLGCFDGEADLITIWKHGDLRGLRLRDHNVTEHEVIMALGEECA